jgi:FNIP Repeat
MSKHSLLDRLMQGLDLSSDMEPTGVSPHKRVLEDDQKQGKRVRRSVVYLPPSQLPFSTTTTPILEEEDDEEEEDEDTEEVQDDTETSASESSSSDSSLDTEEDEEDEEEKEDVVIRENEDEDEEDDYDPQYARTEDDILRGLQNHNAEEEEEESEDSSSDIEEDEKKDYVRWSRDWPRRNKEWAEREITSKARVTRQQQRSLQPENSSFLKLPTDALAMVMAHLPSEDAHSLMKTKSTVWDNDTVVQRGFRLDKKWIKASEQWNIGNSGGTQYKYQDVDQLRGRVRNAIQKLDYDIEDPMSKDTIPPHIVQLSIKGHYDSPIPPGVLPDTLTQIRIGMTSWFDQPFEPGALPPSLTLLYINGMYNQPFSPGSLPESLRDLMIHSGYTQVIQENVLPQSLVRLELHHKNDHPLPTLPSSLKDLELPENYNQPIPPGVMSNTQISMLFLPRAFNQPIAPNTLPQSLIGLVLGAKFNQPLQEGVLPSTLHTLALGYDFIQSLLPNVLPSSLTTLDLSTRYNDFINKGVLPSSLTSISFGMDYNRPLVVGALPEGLTSVRFALSRGIFDQPFMRGMFPSTLQVLTLSYFYNDPIGVGVLPEGLLSLEFGSEFNEPLVPGSLPSTLTHLTFGWKFDQDIQPGVLPESLVELVFPQHYPHLVFDAGILPESLVGKEIYYGATENPRVVTRSQDTSQLIAMRPPRMRNTGQGQGRSSQEQELFADDPRGPHPTFLPMSTTSPPMPKVVRMFMAYFPRVQVMYKQGVPGDKVYGSRMDDPEDDWHYWVHGGQWQEYMYTHMTDQDSTELFDPKESPFMAPYLAWIQKDPLVVVPVMSKDENGFHGTTFIHLTYIIYILFEMYSRVQKKAKRKGKVETLFREMQQRYTQEFIESMLLYEYHLEHKHALEIQEDHVLRTWILQSN